MKESIKQLRLTQSLEFNTFCDKILAHEGRYSKPVIRKLDCYRQLFTAISGNDEFRELARQNLERLLIVELFIAKRNMAQS